VSKIEVSQVSGICELQSGGTWASENTCLSQRHLALSDALLYTGSQGRMT